MSVARSPSRVGFLRLETDAELLARIPSYQRPLYNLTGAALDAFANERGVWRKIVEGAA